MSSCMDIYMNDEKAQMGASRIYRVPVLAIQLLICCAWFETFSPAAAEPIKVTVGTFNGCLPGFASNKTQYCCPPPYNGPIVDFRPKRDPTTPLRVRKALQCLSSKERKVYKKKLAKAYKIMRNLPKDDPRSLNQQHLLHCAYGTGGFVQPGTGNITIDIHFSWLFYPWHRYFVYFHERILQHVLNESDFTIHFWNWDNDGVRVPGEKKAKGGCFKAGNVLPSIYNDTKTALYEPRSNRTLKGLFVDLGITPEERFDPPTRPAEFLLARNPASMYTSMMVVGNTTRGFMGRPYRMGDYRVLNPLTAGGSLEIMGHASTHWWVGSTLARVESSARDPLFYAHHSNIDRLWNKWHHLPSGERKDWSDPDFLEAEFLFWDETATLRGVKVKDALDMEAFGYKYQEVNDATWICYKPVTVPVNETSNSTTSFKPVHFPTKWN